MPRSTVPIEPFRDWLLAQMDRHGYTISDVARIVHRDEGVIRRWLRNERITEATIERAGLALVDDPRLPARLYPQFDWE